MIARSTTQAGGGTVIAYWIFTELFALQMGFTAYAHLCLPQAAQVFARLGFPSGKAWRPGAGPWARSCSKRCPTTSIGGPLAREGIARPQSPLCLRHGSRREPRALGSIGVA